MFRKSYKELYSQKVPEELIRETIYKTDNYKFKPSKPQRKSFKPKIAAPIAAALAVAVGIGSVFVIGSYEAENGFVLSALATETDSTTAADGSVELSASESTFGWTDTSGYDNDNSDFCIEYHLGFKIEGENIESVELDAGDLYLSGTPVMENTAAASHTYIKTFDNSSDKEQTVEIGNLYYAAISDRSDKTVDEMVSNIYNSQKEEIQVKIQSRQSSGESGTITSQEAALEHRTNRCIFDLIEYIFKNAEIKVSVTFGDGAVREQTIYVESYVSPAASVYEENKLAPLFSSAYEDYENLSEDEKNILSYYSCWLSFKYYENGKPDSLEKYKTAISQAEKYSEMFGGYYLSDGGEPVILMTDDYANGKNSELDSAFENVEIKKCAYSKTTLCKVLEKAYDNLYECYDVNSDYLNLSFRTDIENNRLLCVIDDELSADSAENLKKNVRQNIIKGLEKYFEFVTFKAK